MAEKTLTEASRNLKYAWVSTLAGAFIVFVAGNFQYTFGVFVKPLIDDFGWSRAAVSACVTSRNITSCISSPLSGILGDRYGNRKLILIGILLVGVGYFISSRITNLWQLYIFFGALVGLGMPAFFIPAASIATRWFGNKSALANGIITSGFSMGQIFVPPIATALILKFDWRTTIVIFGAAAITLGTAAWALIKIPPSGGVQLQKAGAAKVEQTRQFTLSEALRTRSIWTLIVVSFTVSAAYQMVAIHIVIAAIDIEATAATAALVLTVGGCANTIGRIVLGIIANRLDPRIVLGVSVGVQSALLFVLMEAGSLWLFFVIIAVYGFFYGGTTPLMPTLTGQFFGMKNMGSIFGFVNTAYTLGGAVGPLAGGFVFDITGSYFYAFLSGAIATAIGFIICLVMKPPVSRPQAAASYGGGAA